MLRLSSKALIALRIVQLFLSLLVFILGCVTVGQSTDEGFFRIKFHSQSDEYSIFVGIWGLLVVSYILVSSIYKPAISHPIAVFVLEIVTNIFFFAQWIAVAAFWGQYSCANVTSCKTGKANAAMGAITWATFVVTTTFVIISSIGYFKYRGYNTSLRTVPGGLLPDVPPEARPAPHPLEGAAAGGAELETQSTQKSMQEVELKEPDAVHNAHQEEPIPVAGTL